MEYIWQEYFYGDWSQKSSTSLLQLVHWVLSSLAFFLLFLLKFFGMSIKLSCLGCPSLALPVRAVLRSWTSSGPWMAHCYARSLAAVWADAMSSSSTGPCTRLVACMQYKAVNYIQQTHQCFALSWVSAVKSATEGAPHILNLFEWRPLSSSGGSGPHAARPWPRRRDQARPAGLWTSYPGAPEVNSLMATGVNQQQEAIF